MSAPVDERLDRPGQKRLLAIDGGGLRGMIALQVLQRMEAMLRQKADRKDLVLADYFDYIAGTSTGAIIATGLSLGLSIAEMVDLYRSHGREIFTRARLTSWWYHRYAPAPLERILRDRYGADTTFGSDRLRTLLMLVLRNASTDSPWPLSNNPRAKYNQLEPDGGRGNLDIPLWQLVRASAAAPTLFPPMEIKVGTQKFLFVDGAVTPYNNPAWMLFLMATLEPYRVQWPTGADNMLLVSVGTGTVPTKKPKGSKIGLLNTAAVTPKALITASGLHQDLSCRAFSRCLYGPTIDSEVGDMLGQSVQPLFTYVRYDVELSAAGLASIGCHHAPSAAQALDDPRALPIMAEVGQALADIAVRPEHFRDFPIPEAAGERPPLVTAEP